MCLSDGYHGETMGALSVGGMDLYTRLYKPIIKEGIHVQAPDCYRCPFGKNRKNCQLECTCFLKESFEKHAEETCAFILEPILQGSAGMRIYPAAYLHTVRQLCDQYNVLFIADEIATGFGRTGKMFACDHARVSPDIMCVSKGLTGGYMPMAITITTDKIYNAFYADYNEAKAFLHSHTYSGNPLACTAALAVQRVLQNEDVLTKAQVRAKYLHKQLSEKLLDHPNVGEIRHIGLINAIELVKDKHGKIPFSPSLRVGYQIYKEALSRGLILRPLGDVIYFNPPLIINEEEIDKAIQMCVEALNAILPGHRK